MINNFIVDDDIECVHKCLLKTPFKETIEKEQINVQSNENKTNILIIMEINYYNYQLAEIKRTSKKLHQKYL